jgi:hypothetical protein
LPSLFGRPGLVTAVTRRFLALQRRPAMSNPLAYLHDHPRRVTRPMMHIQGQSPFSCSLAQREEREGSVAYIKSKHLILCFATVVRIMHVRKGPRRCTASRYASETCSTPQTPTLMRIYRLHNHCTLHAERRYILKCSITYT